MKQTSDQELLLFIARNEVLPKTLEAFPDRTRREIVIRLEAIANSLPKPAQKKEQAVPVRERIMIYSDGAARGNPGPAGAGAVLIDSTGQIIERLGKYLGVQTNNYAEYLGLLLGVKRARDLGIPEVEIYADSELMIRQLGGRYQVKSPTLRPLYEEAIKVLKGFAKFKLVHVPREKNQEADEMSNRAIDERM